MGLGRMLCGTAICTEMFELTVQGGATTDSVESKAKADTLRAFPEAMFVLDEVVISWFRARAGPMGGSEANVTHRVSSGYDSAEGR
jgi:hypothetical protein